MIAYTLKQQFDGQWNIGCMDSLLATGLSLDAALSQARHMAHAKRMDSGSPTCVEVISSVPNDHVADEGQPEPRWRSVMS